MSRSAFIKKVLGKWQDDPKGLYLMGVAFVRGWLYVVACRLFRRNIKIKLPFYLHSKVNIGGPGSVVIERGCSIGGGGFEKVSIATFRRDARVMIGKNCAFGGVAIRCRKEIRIGERELFAECLIQDALFCSFEPLSLEAKDSVSPEVEGISIGDSVWLGRRAMVLAGSKIGGESVVSAGGVCILRDIAPRQLASGNPITGSLSIDRIVGFRRSQ